MANEESVHDIEREMSPISLWVLIPEPTARSAVPGVSPMRGLLIPLGYLHPGKCEHSEVQSHPPLCNNGRNGRSTSDGFRRYAHARVQAESGLVPIKLVIG